VGLQERIESSRAGRGAVSAALVVLLALMAVDNLPESRLKDWGGGAAEPVLTALGARQPWTLYAPNPFPSSTLEEARFRYADGSVERWELPKGDPFVSAYRDYRWLKLGEHLHEREPAIDLLVWAVEEHADPRRPLAAARLVRRERDIARPGRPAGERGPWRETVLLELGGDPR
jgi:hypothetical protein